MVLQVQHELDVVNAREVGRSRGLGLLRADGKGVAVDKGTWDEGVVLVWLHQAEVAALLASEAGQVVETQMDVLDGVQAVLACIVKVVVAGLLLATAHGKDELNHGVVKVEVHADLASLLGDLEGLHLADELLKGAGGKLVTLNNVQEDVCGLQTGLQVRVAQGLAVVALDHGGLAVRALDDALELLKGDVHLDGVELQGHQGQCVSRVQGVPEGQRHVQAAALLRVSDQTSAGEALADHLAQTLAGLASQLLPHEQVVVVQGVNDLAANDDAGALDQELANGVGPVSPWALDASADGVVSDDGVSGDGATVATGGLTITGGVTGVAAREHLGASATGARQGRTGLDAGQVDDDVLVVDQVTSAVERDLHIRAKVDCGCEGLLNGLHGEVGVLGIAETEEGDGRRCRQIGVKSS